MTARVSVHCTACDWRGQRRSGQWGRAALSCPRCLAEVARSSSTPGPAPAADPTVELRIRVRRSDLEACTPAVARYHARRSVEEQAAIARGRAAADGAA